MSQSLRAGWSPSPEMQHVYHWAVAHRRVAELERIRVRGAARDPVDLGLRRDPAPRPDRVVPELESGSPVVGELRGRAVGRHLRAGPTELGWPRANVVLGHVGVEAELHGLGRHRSWRWWRRCRWRRRRASRPAPRACPRSSAALVLGADLVRRLSETGFLEQVLVVVDERRVDAGGRSSRRRSVPSLNAEMSGGWISASRRSAAARYGVRSRSWSPNCCRPRMPTGPMMSGESPAPIRVASVSAASVLSTIVSLELWMLRMARRVEFLDDLVLGRDLLFVLPVPEPDEPLDLTWRRRERSRLRWGAAVGGSPPAPVPPGGRGRAARRAPARCGDHRGHCEQRQVASEPCGVLWS